MTVVDRKALREARRKKGWTQIELSEATTIDVSTISRIERGKPVRVRGRTLEAIAKALDVAQENLRRAPEAERDTIKIDLTYVARNALTLVAQRYGITPEKVVEVAPLLFFIAAEQSLQERQERIAELRASADALAQLQSGLPRLPLNMGIHEDPVDWEKISIDELDIFGEVSDGDEPDGYDRAKQNPFVMFLWDKLARISRWAMLAVSIEWDPESWPSYWICCEEAAEIVGDDTEAVSAILRGEAALHEMPNSKDTPEDKAAWVREEAEPFRTQFDQFFEKLQGARHEKLSAADRSRDNADVAAGNSC